MTRFEEKVIEYFDRTNCSRVVCRIKRDFVAKRVVILLAPVEDVESDGEFNIIGWHTSESYQCTLSSWQQYVNRLFPSARYEKDKEIYFY